MEFYHEHAPHQNSEFVRPHPLRRWQPGEPIPQLFNPAPQAALVRNAAAYEQRQLEEAERAARQRRRAA